MQTPVLRAVEVPKHAFESCHMLTAWVVIVPAENSDGTGNIEPRGGHHVRMAFVHQLVYVRIQPCSSGFLL